MSERDALIDAMARAHTRCWHAVDENGNPPSDEWMREFNGDEWPASFCDEAERIIVELERAGWRFLAPPDGR